jgi:hypothetical protein
VKLPERLSYCPSEARFRPSRPGGTAQRLKPGKSDAVTRRFADWRPTIWVELPLLLAFAVFGGITTPALRDVVSPVRHTLITVPSHDAYGTPRPVVVPLHALAGDQSLASSEGASHLELGFPGSARPCVVVWTGDMASSSVVIGSSTDPSGDVAAAVAADAPRVFVRVGATDSPFPRGLAVVRCTLAAEAPPDWVNLMPAGDLQRTTYTPFDPSAATADAITWAQWSMADYVVVAPEAWLSALDPLLALRRHQGHHVAALSTEAIAARSGDKLLSADAISAFVRDLHAHSNGALRYVFLVGDVPVGRDAYDDGPPPDGVIPAGYLPKLDYWTGATDTEPPYPTDDVFAHPTPDASLAVGRFPAHDVRDVEAFVQRLVAYESAPAEGAWRRRVVVFTGPARYGVVADTLIQSTAQHVLDNVLPYDYDLRFTFGFPENPYAVAPQALGDKLVSDLDGGALLAAYVGHGLGSSFDHIDFRGERYRIGSVEDMQRLDIPVGAPFFLSLTCLTGAFDRPSDSLAEAFVRNPHGGIAAFAASRTVHPYANGLLAEAIARAFLIDQARTIGDGLLAVKRLAPTYRQRLLELAYGFDVDALLTEHAGLYNLFGDPATRLRYALPATVMVATESVTAGAATPIAVTVTTAAITQGRVTLTLETQRSVVRGTPTPWAELITLPLDDLRAAMAKNYEQVMDKVVLTVPLTLDDGQATASIPAPQVPGKYYVKVLVEGQGETAVGSARVLVVAPAVTGSK